MIFISHKGAKPTKKITLWALAPLWDTLNCLETGFSDERHFGMHPPPKMPYNRSTKRVI
jgi:hypothetical protein